MDTKSRALVRKTYVLGVEKFSLWPDVELVKKTGLIRAHSFTMVKRVGKGGKLNTLNSVLLDGYLTLVPNQ